MGDEKHTQEPWYITLGYIMPLFNYVSEQGKSLEPIQNMLGLTDEDLNVSDLRLPDSALQDVFVCAERLCKDPNVGLHAGQRMGLSHIGILGHLIMTCTKASQIVGLHTRYQTLVGNGGLSEYEVGLEQVCLTFRQPEGAPPYSRHHYEFNLAGWMTLVSVVAGQAIKPDSVEFPCEAPEDPAEQEAFFAAELRYYDGDAMRVRYGRHHLERLLFPGDSSLREPLEAAARQRLLELQGTYGEGRDSTLVRIVRFVRDELIHGPPSIEQAAEHLQTSVRTLQRQLDAEGVTYKSLVDEARKDLCGRYINNQDLSLIDVALMLGFSEQSSFQRAFKRWFEVTPGEYRRQALA